METRSMTKKEETMTKKEETAVPEIYEFNIDFDDASSCWRANKKHIGNGQFQYICGETKTNGGICIRPRKMGFTRCFGHCKCEKLDSSWLQINNGR